MLVNRHIFSRNLVHRWIREVLEHGMELVQVIPLLLVLEILVRKNQLQSNDHRREFSVRKLHWNNFVVIPNNFSVHPIVIFLFFVDKPRQWNLVVDENIFKRILAVPIIRMLHSMKQNHFSVKVTLGSFAFLLQAFRNLRFSLSLFSFQQTCSLSSCSQQNQSHGCTR